MKIVINPSYAHLREYISDIPYHRYKCDKVYRNKRNTVEEVTAPDGTKLVIKRYKRPTLANMVVYTFLRWSKPRRSCIFAGRLGKYGIQTAEQVAYIETFKWGFFHTGYSITRFIPDELLEKVNTLPEKERDTVLYHFARFTYDLHLKGIKHGDYSAGNVFFRRENGRYIFTLIDINRMQFRRRMTKKACMKEFRRLLNRKGMITVAEHYAALRGWNVDLLCGAILMRRGFNIVGKLKRVLHAVIRPFVSKENRR
ncbi:MAG: lipopolysaccharide kinase InaA family protein [Tannerella sp.]|jgi:hypothetical protein|nr:lipopolysaccharide kinase InaA family protein [Tannerella sp.]